MKIFTFLLILFVTFDISAQSFEKHIRYGDRFYLYHILSNVFGPQSHDILEENILKHPEVFGGSCSLMEEVLVEDPTSKMPKQLSSEYTCKQGLAESKVTMFTRTALVRNSFINKACQQLVSEKRLVNYALREAFLFSTEITTTGQVIKRFYPYLNEVSVFSEKIISQLKKTLTTESIRDDLTLSKFILNNLGSSQNREETFFNNLLYLLCISEEWQIP